MTDTRTNAGAYSRVYAEESPRVTLGSRIRSRIRSLRRFLGPIDDFDWDRYPAHYRAEHEFNQRFFTDDLRDVEFVFAKNKLYLLSDCKPLSPTHRCLLEAICNLPDVHSFAEIGVGGGRHLANIRAILGNDVKLYGYDRSAEQIKFFKQLFPDVFERSTTEVMDLTEKSVKSEPLPDVVFASTVLMHIQRPDAYRSALANFLASAAKFAVIMDNWAAHDYFGDLTAYAKSNGAKLYTYDSGANIAVIVSKRVPLQHPYKALTDAAELRRYL